MMVNELVFLTGVITFLRLMYILIDFYIRQTARSWNAQKMRLFVVRIVSLTHAMISGIFTLFGCYAYPEVWIDPYRFSCHYGRFVSLFSMGYFIHDLSDLFIYGEAVQYREYVIHHLFSIIGITAILSSGRLLGLALICLLVEVQTVFIHARTILRLIGKTPKDSLLYRVVMRCNLGSLILFRHIPVMYLLFYMAFWEHRASLILRLFLVFGLSFLAYHNFHLNFRFLKLDGYLGDVDEDYDNQSVDPLDHYPKKVSKQKRHDG